MTQRPRLLLDVYSDALRTLETEPGPMTTEKADLMRYLRARIADYEITQRLVSSPGHAPNKRP